MKYVLLIVVVLVVLALIKAKARGRVSPRAPDGAAGPQPMVACAHCGVHLPRTETLAGPDGVYCSEAHRTAAARGPGNDR